MVYSTSKHEFFAAIPLIVFDICNLYSMEFNITLCARARVIWTVIISNPPWN